uniref:Uncharacterized protein n=1 Tax=Electrophorus electricus TaxID=8005 RepID=A0AAY5E7L4_ELEEL
MVLLHRMGGCMNVHWFMGVCECGVGMHVCACVRIGVWVFVSVGMHVCACVCIGVWVFVSVGMHVCACVCIGVWVFLCACSLIIEFVSFGLLFVSACMCKRPLFKSHF